MSAPKGTPYQNRIFQEMIGLLGPYGRFRSALDFGSGDGWFTFQFRQHGLAEEVTPIDVKEREKALVKPRLYDGEKLPFVDAQFDLIYSLDVLHHCPDPLAALRELLRCSGRFFLLKDHTYSNLAGWLSLCLLDEIGNRRFGVPSLYHYQKGWEWSSLISECGFKEIGRIHPLHCNRGPIGFATNRLQFLSLWERG